MRETTIICDILHLAPLGDGAYSQEHVARYVVSVDTALTIAKTELIAGYVVNLRATSELGPEDNFDNRQMVKH